MDVFLVLLYIEMHVEDRKSSLYSVTVLGTRRGSIPITTDSDFSGLRK